MKENSKKKGRTEEAKRLNEIMDDDFSVPLDSFPDMDEYQAVRVRKKRKLYLEETDTEIVFYFDPSRFKISKHEASESISMLVMNGDCIGGDIGRIGGGEIRIFFNPLYHDAQIRGSVIEQMMKIIRETAKDED